MVLIPSAASFPAPRKEPSPPITTIPSIPCLRQICTCLLSALGVKIGNVFGSRYEKKAEFAGGVILILLGVKILLEHLGVLA